MEPLTITMYSRIDFDGTTPIDGRRDDFAVSKNGRYFHRDIAGPGGVIRTDFWGLFAEGPKVLGIAASTRNPQNKARLYRDAPLSFVRQVVDLSPQVQHMIVTPGDLLAVQTHDLGPVFLTLTVNDISEQEHVALAAAERQEPTVRRFRLSRSDGQGFVANVAAVPWNPPFAWDAPSQLLGAIDNGTGPIVLSDLLQAPRYQGFYVSVRYSNMTAAGTGKVVIVEPTTRSRRDAQINLANVEWSKPQFLSHGDMLALECGAPSAGNNVVADIEVTPVRNLDRLSGRYDRAL